MLLMLLAGANCLAFVTIESRRVGGFCLLIFPVLTFFFFSFSVYLLPNLRPYPQAFIIIIYFFPRQLSKGKVIFQEKNITMNFIRDWPKESIVEE